MTPLLPALVVAAAIGISSTAAQKSQMQDGSQLVRIQALADKDGVRPGERIVVYVHFEIEPKWHTYWANAGDSGLPTKLDVKAPPGFEVGAAHYSVPTRHELPGDIVDYVHEKEQIVWFELTAPKSAAPSDAAKLEPVRLEISARWLVCDQICLPGSGDTTLDIPMLAADRAPKTIESDTLKHWRALLPRPASELLGLTSSWSASEELELELSVAGAKELEWFPYRDDALHMTARSIEGQKLRVRFEIEDSNGGTPPKNARGLLRVRTEKDTNTYEVVRPLPTGRRGH